MGRELFIGIDIGTQSTRVALVGVDGKVHASYSQSYPLNIPRPGWAEQDPETWWQAALTGIRAVMEQSAATPEEVLGIGCDAQMHATIPLDAKGELLSHAVQLWCDKRGSDLVEAFQQQPYARQAMLKAGSPPVGAWIGFKMLWLKQHEIQQYEKAWKFLTGAGLVNYRLTGQLTMDWSEASGTFLMDAAGLNWSPELADWLGVNLGKLPPIFRSTDVVGRLTPEAARLTGLLEGTPVVAGAGDMLCMLLACGLTRTGRAMDISGTASNLVFMVEKPVLDPPIMNLHHVLEGWCPFGIVETGGGALRWLKEDILNIRSGGDFYGELMHSAAAVEPGSGGLLFLPYLMGERVLGSPNSRGVFFGLSAKTRPAEMVRAVLEGITFEQRRTLEIVERAGSLVGEIHHTGGGARSELWSQIKADVYHKPVFTLAAEEGGAFGAAMLAMVGTGAYAGGPTAAAALVRTAQRFDPRPQTFEGYDRLFELFKDVHDRLQQPFDRLSRII